MDGTGEVTRLLRELTAGNAGVETRLLELVYPRLRAIAASYLRRERTGHTLQPSALVNEAYLQLAGQLSKDWQNRSHFYALAAKLMRQILVDYARQRNAAKREGSRHQIELTDALAVSDDRLDEVLLIDEALQRLAEFDRRRCDVVVLRFFGGMTEPEIAAVLRVSPRTVKRDWNIARAWLHAELSRDGASM